MPKAANLPSLNLKSARSAPLSPNPGPLSARSIDSTQSPRSPPLSPSILEELPTLAAQAQPDANGHAPTSLWVGALPDPPLSPGQTSPKQHSRDTSRNFFANLMASKSSHKLHSPEPSIAEHSDKASNGSRGVSKDRSVRKQNSTPDLPRLVAAGALPGEEHPNGNPKARSKSKLGGILTRTRSGRPEDEKKKTKTPTPLNLDVASPSNANTDDQYALPLRTAPMNVIPHQAAFVIDAGSVTRNRSVDRVGTDEPRRAPSAGPPNNVPREPSILSNISHTGRGVGNRLGQAGRGWLNKMTRSGSTNEREVIADEHYTCTTINLPLVKQTRKTRIAKQLELSRDKTEFWMPALPWRCIDYLNMQCEQEGLYRVPGSGKDVKLWQRRFDTEYDINLFNEPDLYDVNTIASMFKAWLRDLPDELLPKSVQQRIAKSCASSSRPNETPQILKDELSKLPPFQYYLLFAITCHLSLLHSYADHNKMDYRNLCICFQPCLKIDAFCFQYLVVNWNDCWQQGCWTEKQYLEEERRYAREGSLDEKIDERAVSSSNSSMSAQPVQQPSFSLATTQAHTNRSVDNGTSKAPAQVKTSRSFTGRDGREPSHTHTTTAPTLSIVTTQTTPEQGKTRKELPELGDMSPIRM